MSKYWFYRKRIAVMVIALIASLIIMRVGVYQGNVAVIRVPLLFYGMILGVLSFASPVWVFAVIMAFAGGLLHELLLSYFDVRIPMLDLMLVGVSDLQLLVLAVVGYGLGLVLTWIFDWS